MKRIILFIFSLSLFIVLLGLATTPSSINPVSLTNSIGKVRISVFDSHCEPIEMASVCITESHEYHTTGKLGECELSFQTKTDNRFSPSPNWTEYTLIISKNGYIPHILYGLKVQPNITRTGIVITLKEISPYETATHTQSYDFPTDAHSTFIINRYKK